MGCGRSAGTQARRQVVVYVVQGAMLSGRLLTVIVGVGCGAFVVGLSLLVLRKQNTEKQTIILTTIPNC